MSQRTWIVGSGIIFLVAGAALGAAEYRAGEEVRLSGRFTDNLFAAGGEVRGSIDSTDDVFAAGGDVQLEGRSQENFYLAGGNVRLGGLQGRVATVAGGNVNVEGGKFRELIAAGGELRVAQSEIQDDVVLAGGEIRLAENSRIGGSATVAGGNVRLEGTVGSTTRVQGGEVVLGGRYLDEVRVEAESFRVLPGTVFEKDLVHAARVIDIAPDSRVMGKTVALPPSESPNWLSPRGGIFFALSAFLFFIGGLLVIPLIVALFPGPATQGSALLRTRFWESLGKGTLTLLAIPALLFVLFASVVGIPVGLTSLPFLAVGVVLAWSVVVFMTGDQLRRWLGKKSERDSARALNPKQRFAWTFLGAFALAVLLWIPVVGFLAELIAFLAAVGALVTGIQERRPRRS